MKVFVSVALLIASPITLPADIDVDPAPHEAQVRLKAKRVDLGRYTTGKRPTSAIGQNNGKKRPVFRPPILCPVDAETGLYGCRDVDPPEAEADGPELTEGDILQAVREIGLPSLEVQIQPGDETLVNIPTIFYTRPQPFERNVDLLGFDIDLVAQPVRYRWVHGDGTATSTGRPGRPYPAMDVTHRYRKAADDVGARVDVTYRVRYRVDGGAWQTIGQTLLAAGPEADLDVKEAVPVLSRG